MRPAKRSVESIPYRGTKQAYNGGTERIELLGSRDITQRKTAFFLSFCLCLCLSLCVSLSLSLFISALDCIIHSVTIYSLTVFQKDCGVVVEPMLDGIHQNCSSNAIDGRPN